MKLYCPALVAWCAGSHPSRGAWIETTVRSHVSAQLVCRTPHGVRGLKLDVRNITRDEGLPHPSRGAWIETPCMIAFTTPVAVAPLTGCVD